MNNKNIFDLTDLSDIPPDLGISNYINLYRSSTRSAIINYLKQHGASKSIDISRSISFCSRQNVDLVLKRLVRKGFIQRNRFLYSIKEK